jgi:NADH-quinone oxidoreductase subunit M
VSHGLVTVGLFLTYGAVIDRQGSREFNSLGGLANSIPKAAFFLMVFSVASVALPLTSSFVGEFLIILGSWAVFPQWTLIALLGVVFGAVYTLSAYLRTMFGTASVGGDRELRGDLKGGEILVAAALAIAVFALGIFPQRVLSFIEPAVSDQIRVQVASRKEGQKLADASSCHMANGANNFTTRSL